MAKEKRNLSYKPMKIDFNALSGDEFENMCYWLIDDMPEFNSVHQIGVQNTKAVDISAKKGKQLYYFQVKRYRDLSNRDIQKILQLLKEKIAADGIKPDAFVIMTSSEVGEKKRLFMKDEAKKMGLKIQQLEIWDANRMEKLLYKYKKVLNHFYKDSTNVKVKRSSLSTLLSIIGIMIILFILSVVVGLVFPRTPVLGDLSRYIFGTAADELGYLKDFAKDLEELVLVRDARNDIRSYPISNKTRSDLITANLSLLNGEKEKSIKITSQIVSQEEYKDFPPANFILGTAMFINNDGKNEIRDIYDRSIDENTQLWQLLNNNGVLLYHMGEIRNALMMFQKASDLYSKSPEVYKNLSIAYNRLGQSEEALASLMLAQDLLENMDDTAGTLVSSSDNNDENTFIPVSTKSLNEFIDNRKIDLTRRIDDVGKLERILKEIEIQDQTIIQDALDKVENRSIEQP
jgi:tetratricopeptide (TPR) repeat protein